MTTLDSDFSIAPALLHELAQQRFPAGTLYVVATPIGNVGDITLRALHLLHLADAIACEDTRHSAPLLARYGLSKPLIAAHQHNEREVAPQLIERLKTGQRIALIADAGTPAISDPGARIVQAITQAGIDVITLPGACAAVSALAASGLLNDQFYFAGFLPAKSAQRQHMLTALKSVSATLVFYEAPHRIVDSIDALMQVFEPTRQIVLARELTKLFEQIHRCELAQAGAWLAADSNRQKGEFVILLQGAPAAVSERDLEAERILQILLSACPLSQATQLAAQITGKKKNALYQIALGLQAPQ